MLDNNEVCNLRSYGAKLDECVTFTEQYEMELISYYNLLAKIVNLSMGSIIVYVFIVNQMCHELGETRGYLFIFGTYY